MARLRRRRLQRPRLLGSSLFCEIQEPKNNCPILYDLLSIRVFTSQMYWLGLFDGPSPNFEVFGSENSLQARGVKKLGPLE